MGGAASQNVLMAMGFGLVQSPRRRAVVLLLSLSATAALSIGAAGPGPVPSKSSPSAFPSSPYQVGPSPAQAGPSASPSPSPSPAPVWVRPRTSQVTTPSAPSPVAGMDAFAQGQDSSVWFTGWDGAKWTGWTSLGGPFASGPAVASWANGRLDVFATGSDHALWHRSFDSNQWSGWESLGGSLTSGPAVASWMAGRLDIFARGADGTLWHLAWANGWSGWESLGGSLTSAPAVASWAAGRLDVFARGQDNALWHLAWQNGWCCWESLGGGLTAAPAATSWGPGRLDIFTRGQDNALWHLAWQDGWCCWESLGGGLSAGPGAATWGPGQLDVFAAGTDSTAWHLRWGSLGWQSWQPIGGSIISAAAATSWSAVTNVIAGVPYLQQVYELTCEEASLQMALARQGVSVSQAQILQAIGVDGRAGFVDAAGVLHWGNPNTNFVGDPNGSEVALTGYGTGRPSIARVTNGYGVNVISAGEGIAPANVYQAILTNHPVVAWVAFDWRYHRPGSMLTWDGQWVQYEGPIEHAVMLIGVNQGSILVNNPWPANGQQWVSKSVFEGAYATYHDMAVVIQ